MTRRTSKMVALAAIWLITGSYADQGSDVLKGDTFTMPCFDANIPATSYVDMKFTPDSGTERLIAKYSLGTKELRTVQSGKEYDGRISLGSDDRNLVIRDIRIADEGLYKCVAAGFDIEVPIEKSERLNVLVRPVIEVTTSAVYASDEVKEAAQCKASGARPEAVVTWSSDRYLLHNETQTTNPGTLASTTDTTSSLTIVPTKFFNDQPFICTVTHKSLSGGSNNTLVKLDVRYSPTVPIIDVINQNTQLKCRADGNPSPTITWTMPGGNAAPNPVVGSSVVRIISPNDAARQNDTYICHASNNIDPATSSNITTAQAVTFVEVIDQSNTGVVIGAVLGCLAILAIIAAAVYWFCIRKMREKDTGPYPPKKIVRANDEDSAWSRSSSRPIIQHANESLNKNAPPEPSRPPPDDEDDASNSSHSDVEEFTEGDDVELGGSPVGPEDEEAPVTGIISKNSVNFQHRRKRPSTSPHRRSQNRSQPQPSPQAAPRSDPHYEVPPKEYYDDEYDDEQGHLMQHDEEVDDRFYDRPEDRYPGYQPPSRYDEPPMDDHLPPYSDNIQYASIDHSYNPSKPRTRPPYQEPVEYAEIRSKGQIV